MTHQNKKHKPSPSANSLPPKLSHLDTCEWPSFPVFTAVRLVSRECLHASGDEGVIRAIDSFLDELSGSLTFSSAYKNSGGSLRLLQYLAVRESKSMDPFLRRWEVNAVTGEMGARGDLRGLKWVTEKYLPGEFLTEALAQASSKGYLDIVKWLWENHRDICYWGGIELVGAIRNNHYDMVEWLKVNIALRLDCAQHVMKQAAASGNLELVQWLSSSFDVAIVDALHAAALNCQWGVTRWLLENGNRTDLDAALGNDTIIYVSPAQHGDLDMLKFLFERDLVRQPVEGFFQVAAACGHLHIVKWLHEAKGFTNVVDGFYLAAKDGHLDVLKYLHQKNLIADTSRSALDAAAGAGFLEIVQWLHFNIHVSCTHDAMDHAAGRGDLEMVQWLHEHRTEGCSYLAMHYAAENGHLETVKWLHANRSEGCHVLTMETAARHANLEMVQWLHTNRQEAFDLHRIMDVAAAGGDLAVLQWLDANTNAGCTATAMDRAAGCGHLDIVKWLHAHRTEGCTQRAMDSAARNGHLEVVKWLHFNRSEGCSTMAIDGAAVNSRLNMVKWLRRHRSQKCTPLALEFLFSKSRRLDTAVFLFEEFPECRSFHLKSELEVAWLEVVQWLLERTPKALEGCTLKVRSWNWHVWEWLAQNGWKQVDKNEVFSFWNRP